MDRLFLLLLKSLFVKAIYLLAKQMLKAEVHLKEKKKIRWQKNGKTFMMNKPIFI